MSFLDEPSSSGNVPGYGRGDSCVPKIQPRSRLPEPTKTVAEAELAGGLWPQLKQGQACDEASICPGPQPACKVRPSQPPPTPTHPLEITVPVALLLPQLTSTKAFIGAQCMQAASLPREGKGQCGMQDTDLTACRAEFVFESRYLCRSLWDSAFPSVKWAWETPCP